MPDDELWLETESEAKDALPSAAASLLKSVAETLEDAPDGRRYDIRLEVEERTVDGGGKNDV
jgi:hypothetical protein